jgi:hypothetical protein
VPNSKGGAKASEPASEPPLKYPSYLAATNDRPLRSPRLVQHGALHEQHHPPAQFRLNDILQVIRAARPLLRPPPPAQPQPQTPQSLLSRAQSCFWPCCLLNNHALSISGVFHEFYQRYATVLVESQNRAPSPKPAFLITQLDSIQTQCNSIKPTTRSVNSTVRKWWTTRLLMLMVLHKVSVERPWKSVSRRQQSPRGIVQRFFKCETREEVAMLKRRALD